MAEKLTREQVVEKLEGLLRSSKDKDEFMEKCNKEFGGPIIMIHWYSRHRSAYIVSRQYNPGVGASILI